MERTAIHFSAVELGRIRDLARAVRVRGGSDPNEFLARAAVLHADIVMLGAVERAPKELPPVDPGLSRRPGSSRSKVAVVDGQFAGLERADLHWDLARMALDGVTPDPSRDATTRQWYRTIAAYFLHHGNLADAVPHLDRARQLFPRDGGVLFDSGCVHELFASPNVQRLAQTTVLPGDMTIQIGTSRTNLRQAEIYFSRALEIDPGFHEARVRLGRVVALLGRHAEASETLAVSVQAASEKRVR